MMATRSAERTQFIHDIMITALEGGVGYWSVADDIVRHPNDDLWYEQYTLYCSEGGKEALECGNGVDSVCKGHRVDSELIARGLGRINRGSRDALQLAIGSMVSIMKASEENEGGDIDADYADIIVQVGIFGKVVYG